MAGKSDAFEYDLLNHIFCGKPITNFSATAGTTMIWFGLHTADPGDAGSTASEGIGAQYTRASVQRSTVGHTVTSGTSAATATVSPTTTLAFPQNTSTSTGAYTHFSAYPSSNSIGSAQIYFGTLSPNINVSQNVTPQITTGSSITED